MSPELKASSTHDLDPKLESGYWSQISDADRKLKRKFGDLLTGWSPSQDNIILLKSNNFREQLIAWEGSTDNLPYGVHLYDWPAAKTNFETKRIAFNVDAFGRDLLAFRFLAAHEMLHAHTLTAFAPIDFNKIEGSAIAEEAQKGWMSHLALEETVNFLVTKTFKLQEKEIDKLPTQLRIAAFHGVHFEEILEPLRGNVDRELFLFVQGSEPVNLIERMDQFYGKGFFYNNFIMSLICLGKVQRLNIDDENAAYSFDFFVRTAQRAVEAKGRSKYLLRPDVNRARDMYFQDASMSPR